MNKLPVLLCLLAAMAAVLKAAALPTVERRVCSSGFAPGGIFRVELTVELESHELPGAFVISEDWPAGVQMLDSYWQGKRFMPVQRGNCFSWLFGYGEGNPQCSSGRLSCVIAVPDECNPSEIRVFGKVCIAGAEAEITGDSVLERIGEGELPRVEWLELPKGWSLHLMPFHCNAAQGELAGDGACFTLGSGMAWVQVADNVIPPGKPFWLWRREPDFLLLTEDQSAVGTGVSYDNLTDLYEKMLPWRN